MYSIFHPLDPNERLPRELMLEGRRHRLFEIGSLLTWVGFLYLPALILVVVILGSFNVAVAVAIAGAGLVAVYAYVVATRSP
jgi:hypothetical protein